MRTTWVYDIQQDKAAECIARDTERLICYCFRTGSKYITGPSRSNKTGEVGIWFQDPTGTETKKDDCQTEQDALEGEADAIAEADSRGLYEYGRARAEAQHDADGGHYRRGE